MNMLFFVLVISTDCNLLVCTYVLCFGFETAFSFNLGMFDARNALPCCYYPIRALIVLFYRITRYKSY